LLNHVLEQAAKDPKIVEVYLHVQTSNLDAKQFYLSHGFLETDIIKNYYKRIEPPDCFLLRKSLREGYDITLSVGANLQQPANDEN
jgi:ribosomal protein S18 acetylase RimI-like enzyme